MPAGSPGTPQRLGFLFLFSPHVFSLSAFIISGSTLASVPPEVLCAHCTISAGSLCMVCLGPFIQTSPDWEFPKEESPLTFFPHSSSVALPFLPHPQCTSNCTASIWTTICTLKVSVASDADDSHRHHTYTQRVSRSPLGGSQRNLY